MKSLKEYLINESKVKHDEKNKIFSYLGGTLKYYDEIITYPKEKDNDKYNNCLEIEELKTKIKRQGIGTILLSAIKEYADKNNMNIVLYAAPIEKSISEDDLIKFYNKNGFKHDDDCTDKHCLIYIKESE